MLEIFNRDDFDSIFEIMEDSFPLEEYRTYEEQLALLNNPNYRILGIREGKAPVAFAAIWAFQSFTFIEHLATSPNFRDRGLGKKVLCAIIEKSNTPVCLEVEPPSDDLTRRRIGFYERNGMHLNLYPYVQPSISKGRAPIELFIMTSGAQIDGETYKKIRSTLYREVYGTEIV